MVQHGRLAFWQIVADRPNEAYDWFVADPDTWVIIGKHDSQVPDLKSQEGLVGPFTLISPKAGEGLAVFGNEDRIDESQDRFTEKYGSRKYVGPSWVSFVSLGYPIAAVLSFGADDGGFADALGFGLANLGYLLLAAGLIAGHFRALGLTHRSQTLVAGAGCWITGFVLLNI